jgi:hypothetical protein
MRDMYEKEREKLRGDVKIDEAVVEKKDVVDEAAVEEEDEKNIDDDIEKTLEGEKKLEKK